VARALTRWSGGLLQELTEDREVLVLFHGDLTVGTDDPLDGLEEEAPVLAGNLGGIQAIEGGRDVEPLVDADLLVPVELQAAHQARNEGTLLGAHLEISPGERADELHQAKPIGAGELGQHTRDASRRGRRCPTAICRRDIIRAMHRRPLLRRLTCASGLALGLTLCGIARAEPVDLEGTWFVLVHYRDVSTANPDSDRWLDRVWVFAPKGTRLQWTEYPMVVFEDTTGRFEVFEGNPRSRVLAAWEPNGAQRKAIDKGPPVGQRGSKSKSLSGSAVKGWTSTRRKTPGAAVGSAMMIGYQENVTIDGLDALPRFERQDLFGNATRKTAEGYTRFTVTEIDRNGTMHGRYERDGHQEGRFRMWRTSPVREPSKRGSSWQQKQAEFMDDLNQRARNGDVEAREMLREMQAAERRERHDYGSKPESAKSSEELEEQE
jgi:hypothetical protein